MNDTLVIVLPVVILLLLLMVGFILLAIFRKKWYPRCRRRDAESLELQKPLMPKDLKRNVKLKILELWKRTKEEINTLTCGMIHVTAVDTVVDMLQSGRNWVIITGNAGDGKTTLGYLVLKKLRKKMSAYIIEEPEDYKLILNLNKDRVIMFDDRFGAFTYDQVLINKWKTVMKDIHKHLKIVGNQMKVIFISRKNVVNEAREYLGHSQDAINEPENVVDLSSLKIKDERLKILDHYLKQGKLKVSSEVKQKVADLDIAHGFPHCSMMYPKLKAKKCDLDIEEFFKTPLEFLDITTDVLYTNNCKELFELMIKNNGKFDAFSVENDTQRAALLKVEREQEGSYITVWKNGVCVFAHPSIYESVLSVICGKDPLFCVKYAALSVIRQKLTLTSDEKQKSPTQINVKPVKAVMKGLAERFRPEILEGDYSVFNHRFCDDQKFCKELLATCVYSDVVASEQVHSKQHIDSPGTEGKTMLYTSVVGGKKPIVRLLLEHGADVNIRDGTGNTPLLYMCKQENIDNELIKEMVVKRNADCNVQDATGNTPLLYMCKQENIDNELIREMVIKRNADCNVQDATGNTPLLYMCKQKNIDNELIKEMVVKRNADCNVQDATGNTPLLYMCKQENIDNELIKEMVIKRNADCNVQDKTGNTPLLCMCKQENIDHELIKEMVIRGNTDTTNTTDEIGMTALHYLCGRKKFSCDVVSVIVSEGQGDINKSDDIGASSLHWLSGNSNVSVDIIKQLTAEGHGDINKQDDFGFTPLHYLCSRNVDIENLVSLIQEAGGYCNQTDLCGNTPLHYLCATNKAGVSYVLKNIPGADIRRPNADGCTAKECLDGKGAQPLMTPFLDRSPQDLVIKLRHGERKWISVHGRAMILNSERVHEDLQVVDFDRVLTNMERSGDKNSPGQLSRFWGTCSNPVTVPPSPSPLTTPPSYWETSSTLTRRERDGLPLLLEIGVMMGRRNMDEGFCVSSLPNYVCVSVMDRCQSHPDRLCIQMLRKDQEDSERRQVERHSVFPQPGVEFTLTIGLVLDVGRGRVGFIDVERGELLWKVDLHFKELVFPMFYVRPYNDRCATKMRLVSGREICVTDKKIQLIKQALSY